MPQGHQTYHGAAVESRRQSSGPNDASTLPSATNADDSIVLSDLVRSGEASRLRRRGALRLDRNSLASGHAHHRRLSFESDFESDDGSWTSRPHTRWLSGVSEHSQESEDDAEYVLVCGAEVEGQGSDCYGPYEPSILPIDPSRRPRRQSYTRPTNGCGTFVHLSASPSINCRRGPGKTYIARGPATDSVVHLDPEYFDAFPGVKFERNSCGCVKEGVGCAVCGNALGTRWRLCKAMAAGQRKAPWRSSGEEEAELFTFFATAVTARQEESYTKPSLRASSAATLSAKPSQEWSSNRGVDPPRYPENDWLGALSNHYDSPQPGLAISVEVTSSISYSARRRSAPDLDSTMSTVEAERPPLFPSHSAPAAVFAYHLTASPESISQPLPDEDLGPAVVRRDASDSSSSVSSSSSGDSFADRRPSTPAFAPTNPVIDQASVMDGSDESHYAYPGMSLFEQQVGSPSSRRFRPRV
ncbi:hypothetical protein FA13DRAFT_288106 [Coprinellus micaceus]|uniref:Uncharacterized protein n=1 Tax=Coprinellus micaceus TaxID=71717 RepID=A0A4Y7TDC5_COPMI|nr:hypothetical protein FA13DRAFT_288106 [Coprinellus micaceus]